MTKRSSFFRTFLQAGVCLFCVWALFLVSREIRSAHALARARAYLLSGSPANILTILQNAPDSILLHGQRRFMLGKAYFKLGQYPAAIDQLEQARQTYRDYFLNLILGNCYQQIGQFSKALEQYRIGLAYNPQQPDLRIRSAELLARLAERDLQQAAQTAGPSLTPGECIPPEAIQGAIEALLEAVALMPEEPEYLCQLGAYYLLADNRTTAEHFLLEGLGRDPYQPMGLLWTARLLMVAGESSSGLICYRVLVDMVPHPGLPEVLLRMDLEELETRFMTEAPALTTQPLLSRMDRASPPISAQPGYHSVWRQIRVMD